MKYRTMWEWLAIEPTTDINIIKKAFASRAKEYHPEEYPKEFQALQKSYHAAMAYAKASLRAGASPTGTFYAAGGMQQNMQNQSQKNQPVTQTKQVIKEQTAKFQTESQSTAEETKQKTAESRQQDSLHFNYDAIGDALVREQWETMIAEFVNIAYHAYLRNHLLCWQYFFGQKKYQEFFNDPATWKELIYQIKCINGWKREIILFFEKCMHQHLEQITDRNECPVFPKRKKRRRIRRIENYITSVKVQASQKEKELFQFFIKQLQSSGRNSDLNCYEGIANYLWLYLPYAAKHPKTMELFYRTKSERFRASLVLAWIFGLIFIMSILMTVQSIRQENKQEKTQKYVEKKIDDIQKDITFDDEAVPFDDEKYQEEMDRILEDAKKYYETWEQQIQEQEMSEYQVQDTEELY